MKQPKTQETELRLAIGRALEHVNWLRSKHGEDFFKDEVKIHGLQIILAKAISTPFPTNPQVEYASKVLFVVVHVVCVLVIYGLVLFL